MDKTLEQLKIELEETLQMPKKESKEISMAKGVVFPEGTSLKLTTRKYLWAILGAASLDIPVESFDQVWGLIGTWYDLQKDLEDAYKKELDELYTNAPSKGGGGYSGKKRSGGGGGDYAKAKAKRNRVFELGSVKGVYVKARWPNIGTLSEGELDNVLATLEDMPDKGEKKEEAPDTEARSRVERSRRSR